MSERQFIKIWARQTRLKGSYLSVHASIAIKWRNRIGWHKLKDIISRLVADGDHTSFSQNSSCIKKLRFKSLLGF